MFERYLRREAPGRIEARGVVAEPLDEGAVRAEGARLAGEGVESIAVCLINSHKNGSHEQRVGEILAEAAPGIPISLSREVLPEIREHERTSQPSSMPTSVGSSFAICAACSRASGTTRFLRRCC